MRRRTFLGLCGTVAAGLSGCASDTDGTGEATTDAAEATDTAPAPTTAGSATATATAETTTVTASSRATTDTPIHQGYETTEVRVLTPEGDRLGSVTAAIADTRELRYLGLSDTESLPADRGMLFVYETVDDRTFVMREMDFGIDIVYADADGAITRIHHAPEPGPNEDGEEQRYPGRGQYVLEVGYHWTTDRGISEGDRLAFSLPE
jgi:uncharacterized membrane protein (UPF0127 family)